MTKAPITVRVLILRLFAAVFSTILLYFGATALCQTLEIPERFVNATLFTIFCSEMLYATIAHVANDWLAIGVGALFLAALARFVKKPDGRTVLTTGLSLTAGLLTKAYFLVFALPACAAGAILIWRRRIRAMPVLTVATIVLVGAGLGYRKSGPLLPEEFNRIGIRQALAAAPRINWVTTTGFLARSSLWTGNNSFTSFSRSTLNIVLGLLLLAVAAWGLRTRDVQPAERITFAAIVLFSLAIAYDSCASFALTNGEAAGASPWYAQVLLAPVMALAYVGMSRWKGFGRVLAACTTAIWTWVLLATWTVKLFPMYSGGGTAPMRTHDIWNWYVHGAAAHTRDLSLLALAPAPLLYGGLSISSILGISLGAVMVRDLIAPGMANSESHGSADP